MDPVTFALLYGGFQLIRKCINKYDESHSSNASSLPINVPSTPKKFITFIGATGVGKSSTANALLGYTAFRTGVDHGTTTSVMAKEYQKGYSILDTPGLMDHIDFSSLVWSSVKESEITIYTVTQQLFRKEIEMVEAIRNFQKSDSYNRKLALYVNMQDIAKISKTSATRIQEISLIRQQVSQWIPPEQVVLGSAHPMQSENKSLPQVKELESLIQKFIS